MDQVLSAEQVELGRTVRNFLKDKASEEAIRAAIETEDGFDRQLWKQMSEMLGLSALIVPEEFDGVGGTHVDLGVVLTEMGRALVPSPMFATVALAANALLLSNDSVAMKNYLPRIAAGEVTATVAVPDSSTTWNLDAVETKAVQNAGWRLTGLKDRVLDGSSAELILVLARTAEGELAFFAVSGDAEGLERESLTSLDLTTRVGRLHLRDVPAELVGKVGDGTRIAEALLERAVVLNAADQIGGMEKVLEMAVEYAKTRYQFGRAIGSFQAIKHRCADMLTNVARGKVGVSRALWSVENAPEELTTASSLVKSFCSDAYFQMATSNIALHGGVGYTWEHPAHLYYRRAKGSQMRFGSPSHFRERLMREVLG